jgi:transcriptional regulator with XRE-family HTH domain
MSEESAFTMVDETWTDEAVLVELGRRLERRRLDRNETQAELAARAGVDRTTVIRIEQGAGGTVKALLRILRADGLLGGVDALVPAPEPSPLELLERRGRRRRRASRRGRSDPAAGGDGDDEATGFQWGTT